MSTSIGIDIGGTNLRAAAFGEDTAAPIAAHREPVGDDREPAALIERTAAVIERLAGDAPGPIPVGVGIAAMLRDAQGNVARSPHLRWRDVAFGRLLRDRLGPRFPLGVYNDVNAITWGESVAGAARGCRDVLAVYCGTGIGGGVIANGRLLDGATSCAGEFGHIKVRWDDGAMPCACGGRGCVETYVGGVYLTPRIQRELGDPSALPGDVDRRAADGDPWALALWTEISTVLAVALANALSVLNSERLILGGGVLSRTPTLIEFTETALMIVTPPAILEPLTVAAAELGDDAGLVGAAHLARTGVHTSTVV